MHFPRDPVFEAIAKTPAARLVPPSEDPWALELQDLFKIVQNHSVEESEDVAAFKFHDRTYDEPILTVRTAPDWTIIKHDNISSYYDAGRPILSQAIENWAAHQLEYIDSIPTNRAAYPATDEEQSRLSWLEHLGVVDFSLHPSQQVPVQQLRNYLYLTLQMQRSARNALFTGYLPRHHLPLAVLFQRIPELIEYAASFPTLLTHLADELIYGDCPPEGLLLEVSGLLQHGWRGLFVACGLNPTLKNVMFAKRIVLRKSEDARLDTTIAPPRTSEYLNLFGGQDTEDAYLVRGPVHETVFIEFDNLRKFFMDQPGFVNFQVNQHLRIFSSEKDQDLLCSHLGDNFRVYYPKEDVYCEVIAGADLPILKAAQLAKTFSTVQLNELTPEEFKSIPSPQDAEIQDIFERQLSLDDQFQLRHLYKDRKIDAALHLLECTQLSKAAIRFLHAWNALEIDKALLKQFALPNDIIEKFLSLYPEETRDCQAYLFGTLAGEDIEPSRDVRAILNRLRNVPEENSTTDQFLNRTDFRPLRPFIQTFGHTHLGPLFADAPYFKMPCLMAKALWYPPQKPVWERLLTHPRWEVQACLTLNPYVPAWVRKRLARHPLTHVRAFLAEQPWFIIDEVLPVLLQDESDEVIQALAANNSLPEDILLKVPLKSFYMAALLFFNRNRGDKLTKHLIRFGFDGEHYLRNPGFTDSNRGTNRTKARNNCSTSTV